MYGTIRNPNVFLIKKIARPQKTCQPINGSHTVMTQIQCTSERTDAYVTKFTLNADLSCFNKKHMHSLNLHQKMNVAAYIAKNAQIEAKMPNLKISQYVVIAQTLPK